MNKWLEYLNIESELEDNDKIHSAIEKDIVFKGTNLWILVFAIIVASVGLNINSTAVIIGAMLISPLMGPINGIGYSIATYDFKLLRKALKNFSFAVFTGLFASSAYFLITPVSTAHSELLARTSPTIYDVLIALFGGLAGILAISSKQKGNVIPGVAIATALMPPLCTAGYGLATLQMNFLFGALYLFTINAVFIGISAVVMSQLLKFPLRSIVEEKHRKRVNRWITVVIIITIIPSIYFGYQLVLKERFLERATKYVKSIGILEGSYLMRQDINPDRKLITLVYGGNLLSQDQKIFLNQKAGEFSIDTASVRIQQGFAISDNEDEKDVFTSEINRLSLLLKTQTDSIRSIHELGKQLFTEIHALYPNITSASYSQSYLHLDNNNPPPRVAIVYITVNDEGISENERETLKEWLQKRLNTTALRLVIED
ncbi:MAG TPA: DUF389 domain-containing protein [Lentimicrobium sp.]|nr:DUF389 domain-containing protein [Lentimicrobium sp.]